jgi:hypothetical protein
MPTVSIIDGFRFYFYSNEHEPIHIHIEKDNGTLKIELETLKIVYSINIKKSDIQRALKITKDNRGKFMEAWYEYFQQ